MNLIQKVQQEKASYTKLSRRARSAKPTKYSMRECAIKKSPSSCKGRKRFRGTTFVSLAF
jgi:hypothetical protein